MNDKTTQTAHSGMSLGDIYFVLFRRKWLILWCSLAGILAALAVCLIKPPQYKSEAELSLSILEAKPMGVPWDETRPVNELNLNIINTEIKILQSLDLAQHVVQAMTPAKILAGRGVRTDTNAAAYVIKEGLTVEATPGSSVIHLTFLHPGKQIVQPALSEIIDGYFVKHFKMHGGGGVFGDFLTNETARLHGELLQTEMQIQQAQSEAGLLSADDGKDAYSSQSPKLRGETPGAGEELAEGQAVLKEPASSNTVCTGELAARSPAEQFNAYRRNFARLIVLRNMEENYLSQQGFTEENVMVKDVRSQIANLQQAQNRLQSQFDQVWTGRKNLERVAVTLSELQQKKESAEASLKYFTEHLERTRIDDALSQSKASNISIIQSPTPPLLGWSTKTEKIVALLAAGGILVGLALAFLIEIVLDRSVKRPSEIEIKLGLPLLISIPDANRNGYGKRARILDGRLNLNHVRGGSTGRETLNATGIAPWDREHPLRRFYEGLRDRLIVYFEVRNLVHKPKLVAVTSCGGGAGVSSIAAGLAATLSETGDGNVLLVNISGDKGAAQQFYKGEPGYSLDEVLETDKKGALVKASLYTVTERVNGDMLPANLPKKLSALMPKLKASVYDYIIFDMPPVDQTSATARLSGLMDMVLLVIESEKTNQDVVKRVIKLLAESRATVSTVLNKSRNFIPAKLHQEFLNCV